MELNRYDIYAQYDASYDDEGKIDYVHAYTDYCEDASGDWVRAEDALPLLGRITFLEAQVKKLQQSQVSQDDWEPTMRFFRD